MKRRSLVRRTLALSCLLAGSVAAPASPSPAPPAAAPAWCDALDLSPNFGKDRTALCVGWEKARVDLPATGVNVFLTTDGGRTWRRRPGAGLVFNPDSRWTQVVFSPRYADDHAVYVQDQAGGVYRTTDGGTSFLLLDPVSTPGSWLPSLARIGAPLALPAGPSTATLAYAGTVPALLAPPVRVPVAGPGGMKAESFLVPASFPARPAYVVALAPTAGPPAGRHYRVMSCDPALTCATEVASVPIGWHVYAAELTGPAQRLVVVGIDKLGADPHRVMAWRSSTDGRRIERYPALEALLAPIGADVWSLGIAGLPNGELAVLVDHAGNRVPGVPARQLFVSRGGGTSWTRVAYGRNVFQKAGPRGTLPRAPIYPVAYNQSRLWVTPEGKLLIIGAAGPHVVSTVFCSTGGKVWRTSC